MNKTSISPVSHTTDDKSVVHLQCRHLTSRGYPFWLSRRCHWTSNLCSSLRLLAFGKHVSQLCLSAACFNTLVFCALWIAFPPEHTGPLAASVAARWLVGGKTWRRPRNCKNMMRKNLLLTFGGAECGLYEVSVFAIVVFRLLMPRLECSACFIWRVASSTC